MGWDGLDYAVVMVGIGDFVGLEIWLNWRIGLVSLDMRYSWMKDLAGLHIWVGWLFGCVKIWLDWAGMEIWLW